MITENAPVPADRRVWNESRTLAAAGWEVVVVGPARHDRPFVASEIIDGIEVHRYPLRSSEGGARGYFREYSQAMWRIRKIVRRLTRQGRFDVVHTSNPPDFLLLAALSARRQGARFVFDHHDLGPELFRSRFAGGSRVLEFATRAAERMAFALADVTLSTNETYRKVALRRGHMCSEDVFVVRNGPDLDRFRPADPDPALRRGRPNLIAYVGIMGPQDGVDHALRALAWLRERRDDWHAILAGDGEVLASMQDLAADLGLADSVEFAGWMGDSDLRRLLSTADVCVAPDPPSPLNNASTMVKIPEYMAMGCPIVSYDLAESRASAGEAAVYATEDNPEALGRCLHELLDDPGRRNLMGRVGTERVQEALAWQHAEAALLAAYDRVREHRAKPNERADRA